MQLVSGSDRYTYSLIKQGLSASNIRAKAIANNMANINTKDYKRFNVIFEENIKNSSDLKLKTTREAHYTDTSSNLRKTRIQHISGNDEMYSDNIIVKKDKNTSMRADGNNVDLEIEKANQAANQLKYNALITCLNSKYTTLKGLIK